MLLQRCQPKAKNHRLVLSIFQIHTSSIIFINLLFLQIHKSSIIFINLPFPQEIDHFPKLRTVSKSGRWNSPGIAAWSWRPPRPPRPPRRASSFAPRSCRGIWCSGSCCPSQCRRGRPGTWLSTELSEKKTGMYIIIIKSNISNICRLIYIYIFISYIYIYIFNYRLDGLLYFVFTI